MTQPSMAQIPLDKIKESPLNNRDPRGRVVRLGTTVLHRGYLGRPSPMSDIASRTGS